MLPSVTVNCPDAPLPLATLDPPLNTAQPTVPAPPVTATLYVVVVAVLDVWVAATVMPVPEWHALQGAAYPGSANALAANTPSAATRAIARIAR